MPHITVPPDFPHVSLWSDCIAWLMLQTIFFFQFAENKLLIEKTNFYRENKITSVGLCVINTSRRGYPPEDGAHIALREWFRLNFCS